MSISFIRNGKLVKLQTFSNDEVISYLALKLNTYVPRLKLSAKPKFCNGVMAKLDDTNFIVHAERTWVELSFDKANAPKMAVVIDEITKWEKFSKTEKTFYVEIDEDSSRTIIFENGYSTCGAYRKYFGNAVKITSFND